MVDTKHRAIDRLDADMRFKLDNIAASWRMEGMSPSEDEINVLARYLLGEIDAEERHRQMQALLD